MMKTLRRRVFKIVPIWLIIGVLLLAGGGFAAYTWISNQLANSVTVVSVPVVLSGTLPIPQFTNYPVDGNITYTCTGYNPQGYVFVEFKSNNILTGNIFIFCNIWPSGGPGSIPLVLVNQSSPNPNTQDFVFGATASTPVAFGATGSTGKLEFIITTTLITGVLTDTVQLTSTSS